MSKAVLASLQVLRRNRNYWGESSFRSQWLQKEADGEIKEMQKGSGFAMERGQRLTRERRRVEDRDSVVPVLSPQK